MTADDPRVERARGAVRYFRSDGRRPMDAFTVNVFGAMIELLDAHDEQVAVHKQTSKDLQAWRRRAQSAEKERDELRAKLADAWVEGVDTALNYAKRNDDGITLRLETISGGVWPNPYDEAQP